MRQDGRVDIDWLLALSSLVVGVLVGLTGVGGGALMTPILIGGFSVAVPVAIATDLLFATITKILGVAIHRRAARVDWKVTRALWSGSLPGVLVGSLLLVGLVTQGVTHWLIWLIVVFVALTGWTLLRRGFQGPATMRISQDPAPRWLAPLGGVGIGLGVSLTSVGAGVLGMALLVRISPRDSSPQRLVASDLLHAVPVAMIAGASYTLSGLVDWALLATLLLGSLPGVVTGALLAQHVPSRVMNLFLGAILLGLAVILLLP